MITRYIFSVIASLIFSAIAFVIAPILPLFAHLENGPLDNNTHIGVGPRLPSWLAWFMTPDNALTGDATFAAAHDGGYWSQVLWLIRNPAYGFDLLIGVAPFADYTVRGNPHVTDNPGCEGWRLYSVPGAFSFLWVKKLAGDRCTHFEFGWKFDTGSLVFSPRFSHFVA
jgi:hypothetical protein